jgi:thioesterase domain-containing protein/aryl carrier-like protein
VLPCTQVGVKDNFFDLGGDSIRLAQVHTRLQKLLGRQFPITDLFAHTTVQELAKVLSAKKLKTRELKPELIHLQLGNSGPEVFFLIDEGSLGLFKLAHFMGKDLPLYASVVPLPKSALRASAERRLSALPRMEDLAVDHVALIMEHQSTGPLVLAGHCFGGMLAFEVAHQLQRAGRQVEAVLMLDTWMIEPAWWWRKKTWCQAHFRNLRQKGPSYFWRKVRRRVNLKKDELASKYIPAIDGDLNMHVPWPVIDRIYLHAMLNYHPRVLGSRGISFVSEDDWQSNAYRKLDNSLGAGRVFAGGLDVIDVPGDHVTVLYESHLPELARRFRKGLEILRS